MQFEVFYFENITNHVSVLLKKQLTDPKYPLILNVFNCSEAFSPPISEITSYFKDLFAHMDDQE